MDRFKKRVIAGITAILMAASVVACTGDEDPNGTTDGDTNDTEIATTTSTPATDTTLGDVTTTTP